MSTKLFGILFCVFFSALAVFGAITGFAPRFETKASWSTTHSGLTGGAIEQQDKSEVIVINEEWRSYFPPLLGYGTSPIAAQELRMNAERMYRGNYFPEAIKSFQEILQFCPTDMRAQLGLAKSFIALKKYDASIKYLSKVRNECHRVRYRDPSEDPKSDRFGASPIVFSDIDVMPDLAGDALDHEARQALETAVLATISPELPDSPDADDFKNDQHFKLVNASLALAKKYHEKRQVEELAAMYQLAQENTRTMPADLVTDCCIKSKGAEERWQELARLSLNAANDEERNWYLKRLGIEHELSPKGNIKNAALNHALLHHDLAPNSLTKFNTVEEIRKARDSDGPKHAMFYANTAFDYGFREFQTHRYPEARDYFLLARDIYSNCGTRQDLVDTNYNLGLIYYQLDLPTIAKQYFKLAANFHDGKVRFEPNELIAAFNYGVCALDLPESDGDEKFLDNLYKQTRHPEAAFLLGMHYMQKNDFEKAYAPFKAASVAKFLEVANEQPAPARSIANNRIDRKYSDDQMINAMFARHGAIESAICSRFAPYSRSADENENQELCGNDGVPKLTCNRFQNFERTIRFLFPTILMKTNRDKELKEYLSTNKIPDWKTADNLSAEQKYSSLIQEKLYKFWYCPTHNLPDQVIVRARATQAGTLAVSRVESTSKSPQLLESSVADSIKWCLLPAPPPGYTDKELILVFNATFAKGVQQFGGPYLPTESAVGEW